MTTRLVIFIIQGSEFATLAAAFVFLSCLGSRLLILFSGIDTSYYSRRQKATSPFPLEHSSFFQMARWVGTFYHYHDLVLFAVLIGRGLSFLVSLAVDWIGNHPFGDTLRNLRDALSPTS